MPEIYGYDDDDTESTGYPIWSILCVIFVVLICVSLMVWGIIALVRQPPTESEALQEERQPKQISNPEAEQKQEQEQGQEQTPASAVDGIKKLINDLILPSTYKTETKKCICEHGDHWRQDQCQSPDVFVNGTCYRDNVSVAEAALLCATKQGCMAFDHVPAWGNRLYYKTVASPIRDHDVANVYTRNI